MDMYNFYMGRVFNAYEYLGSHVTRSGVTFRTYAPNAVKVSLLHSGNELPMQKIYDGNFYELQVGNAISGDLYEYRIYLQNGSYTDHSDPYVFKWSFDRIIWKQKVRQLCVNRSALFALKTSQQVAELISVLYPLLPFPVVLRFQLPSTFWAAMNFLADDIN